MGNSVLLYVVVGAVALIGLIGTLWVGLSRENREGNPAYDRSTKPNWLRLTLLYVAAAAVMAGLLIWFLG